jgi:hypothetical protein
MASLRREETSPRTLDVFPVAVRSVTVFPFVGHSDAPREREVEQIRSNLMALIGPIGSRSSRMWKSGQAFPLPTNTLQRAEQPARLMHTTVRVSNLTSRPPECRCIDAGDKRLALSRRGNDRVGFHEIKILSHCVDLVIELAREGNNFGDECRAADRELGQMDVLVSDFREVIIETDSFGISARGDELDLEIRLSPNHGIESRPVGSVLDERDTRVIFPNEPPKGPTKFFCIALLAELIDEIVLFALALPCLDHTTTRVGSSAMSGIDAKNDGTDRQLERRKTLEMFSSCFQCSLRAEALLVKQLKRRGNLSAPEPLDFGRRIGLGPQDIALLAGPFLVTKFISSPLDCNER